MIELNPKLHPIPRCSRRDNEIRDALTISSQRRDAMPDGA